MYNSRYQFLSAYYLVRYTCVAKRFQRLSSRDDRKRESILCPYNVLRVCVYVVYECVSLLIVYTRVFAYNRVSAARVRYLLLLFRFRVYYSFFSFISRLRKWQLSVTANGYNIIIIKV